MKLTPGPWTFIAYDKTATFFTHSIRGQNTHEQYFGDLGPTVVCLPGSEESMANGHLIAAAPEMLELLEDFDFIIDKALTGGHHDLVSRLRKIIKKAKGMP